MIALGVFLATLATGPVMSQANDLHSRSIVDENPRVRPQLVALEPLLWEIADEGAHIAVEKYEGLFIYAEMDERQGASVMIFRDRGKTVKWYVASPKLQQLIEQAWLLESGALHWRALAYSIADGKADVHLVYPEEFDSGSSFEERLLAERPESMQGKKLIKDRQVAAFMAGE